MMWRCGLIVVIAHVAMANIAVLTRDNVTERTFYSLQATFGPRLGRWSKVLGYMVEADPIEACENNLKPPREKRDLPWFVLIARTPNPLRKCPFDLKVLNAQKAGYHGAVIFNVQGNDQIIVMHPSGAYAQNITIPSQFIGYDDAQRLMQYIGYSWVVEMNGHEPIGPDPYLYIVPFFVVICIIVFILVIALIVKLCREYMHSRRSRLSKRNLKKLPTKKFVKNADPFETCAICLDDFEDGDKIRILPCNHAYHCQCIDPWLLKRKRSCPVCKRKIHFGRRRRDAPTAEPDSSDSEATVQPGDERTPLLGAAGGNSSYSGTPTATSSVNVGAINSGSEEENSSDEEMEENVETDERRSGSRFAFLGSLYRRLRSSRNAYVEVDEASVAGNNPVPSSYGSFDTASRDTASLSSSHLVEVHPPPEPDQTSGVAPNPSSAQAPPVPTGSSVEVV